MPQHATNKSKLKKLDRQARIVAELRANPTVRISELAHEFHVTTETVRRDVDALARKGMVSRTYGGAAAMALAIEPTQTDRYAVCQKEREKIARSALSQITNGDVVIMESSATTAIFAHRLTMERANLTVITNGIRNAQILSNNDSFKIVVCPGFYRADELGIYGAEAIAFLNRFTANISIIGAGGMTDEGPQDFLSEVCWLKRCMIDRGQHVMLLADHSKFGVSGVETICSYDQIDTLVVDREPPPSLRRALDANDTQLVIAR